MVVCHSKAGRPQLNYAFDLKLITERKGKDDYQTYQRKPPSNFEAALEPMLLFLHSRRLRFMLVAKSDFGNRVMLKTSLVCSEGGRVR
jgi:hypothetical protein